ncbi:DUF4394 domain-containing protein [Spirosoma sp. KCTC 42546]|uniref:DUF4394 domain-containing protein n=1 Tax=Spirosoma sp. KCTC 42546 TaxID=2520506 RepID=UPI0011580AF9|nr:DUF4394 domain-containing protein [Spirosoma sp. KCTC 42546]QDK82747.1 DUF4394 domain-containing protein [Spirosoma sp. KCTC 42546]
MAMLYKKPFLRVLAGMLALGSLLTLNACQDHRLPPDPGAVPDASVYLLNDANQLQRVNIKNPNVVLSNLVITGVNFQAGERMLSIDFRPATGQLYGVSSMSRLFVINPTTAEARPLTTSPFTPAISGSVVGIDFNPTVDRIRLVTNTGQDLRLHPETGQVVAVDGAINGVSGAMISEVAYTNNSAGVTTTTLYDIDPATDRLYIQNPPNNGTLTDVGPLGLDIAGSAGFDISPNDNTQGLVAVQFNGSSELDQINLATGRLQKLGNLTGTVIGLAIPTNPVAYAIDSNNSLLIFNPVSLTGLTLKTITGLQPGETILGIDSRPVNGQLFVLGSTSRLYTVAVTNTNVWSLVQVGSAGAFTLSGTDFGFDFNPTVDRIRVVSNTGQNLRLNPDNGALAATDGNLNPGTPNVTAAAYTNNFAGALTTTLYDIDIRPGSAVLLQQNPPNNGTLVSVGPLGVEVESANGFDIGGATGTAYALLRTGGNSTKVYTINLATGAATAGPTVPGSPIVRGFTVGLGF